MNVTIINKTERDAIVAREETLRAYCVEQGFTNKHNGWTSYKPEQVARLNPPTNDERAQVELFDFVTNPPDRYFLYIREETREAVNFTGVRLGTVSFGREWRDNFGGTRRAVSIRSVNGVLYHGTYFKSSGDFARVKRAVRQ